MSTDTVKTLFVTCNGKEVNNDYKSIFGNGEFDDLKAISYVSSPQFLSQVLTMFDTASIILGIDSPNAIQKIDTYFNGGNIKFYNGLSDSVRDMIDTNKLELLYSAVGFAIHTKLYLLSSTETGRKRVILGSANLTANALTFGGKEQFEDLVIFDDVDMYDLYLQRFNQIKEYTVDFVSPSSRKAWHTEHVVLDLTASADSTVDYILHDINVSDAAKQVYVAAADDIKDLESRIRHGDDTVSQAEANIYELARSLQSRGKRGGLIMSDKTIRKALLKVITKQVNYAAEAEVEDAFRQLELHVDYSTDVPRVIETCISADGHDFGVEYSQDKLSDSEIRSELLNIEKFIATYRDYTVNAVSDDYLSYVYESILYTLIAPAMADLRNYIATIDDNRLKYFPVYLAIGGKADTGKSHLLSYLYKLASGERLSNAQTQYSYMTNRDAYGQYLDKAFSTGNRAPLFVDEVPPSFFSGSGGGNRIRNNTNHLTSLDYAPVICTTNSPQYAPTEGVGNRVKYLPIDAVFDVRKNDGELVYAQIVNDCTGRLARDFIATYYNSFVANPARAVSGRDYLYLSRLIFKAYYKRAGLALPEYFPEDVQDFSSINCCKLWRETWFDTAKHDLFVIDDATVRIETRNLFKTAPRKDDLALYENPIPGRVLLEKTGPYLILNRDEFFDWIDVDFKPEPEPKKSLFARIFS